MPQTRENDSQQRRSLLAQLDYVELAVSGRTSVVGSDLTDPGVMDWSAAATIRDPSDEVGTELESDLRVDGIALSTTTTADHGQVLTLFEADGIIIDLTRADDVFDALDARSADDAHFLPLFDGETGFSEIAEELDATLEIGASRVLIVHRVRIAPAWRGLGGVGRLLIGRTLAWMCTGSELVAVNPFPIDLGPHVSRDGELFADSLRQVQRTWASIGFNPFKDDIWIMDPALGAHERAIAEISRELGLD
ncbi:hypothetical protein ABZ805_10300 [Saccharopolyspora sp. NPDC047091]|uniref:hypothetical protein n=1 Tax=Saccharopolyspora sp. NPDC047091 TaxID=3155924 RepID=UPI0033FC2AC2